MTDTPFKNFSKKWKLGTGKVFSLGTVSVLLFFGTMFYFYVSQNYTYLVERNFRVLATWSQELQATFENYQRSFQFRLQEIQTGAIPSKGIKPRSTTKTIPPTGQILQGFKDIFILEDPFEPQTIQRELEKLPFVDQVQIGPTDQPATPSTSSSQEIDFFLHQGQKAGQLAFEAQGKKTSITAAISVDMLMKHVATSSVFQDVLLADPTGDIVYQHNPSTLQFSHLQNLFHNQRIDNGWLGGLFNNKGLEQPKPLNLKDFAKTLLASTPAHFQATIGGTTFEVFIQTVGIPQINDDHDPNAPRPQSWILCGLLPTPQFQEQYLSIPFTFLLLFIFILISAFLALPLTSLILMNPRERLSRFSVGMLIIANVLWAGVATFFILDFAFYKQTNRTFNQRMAQTAESIHDAFQLQVDRVLSQLLWFDQRIDALGDLERFPPSKNSESWLARINIPDPCLNSQGEPRASCFPNFSVAFWIDQEGLLRETWTREDRPYVHGVHNLGKRAYVSSILHETHPLNRRLIDGHWVEFFAQPLISLESSQRSLVLSLPHHTLSDSPNSQNTWIAAIQTEAFSLLKPAILPPDAGFAVIEDQSGLVLFHSDLHRMLRENFLEETDNQSELTSLIHARAEGPVEGNYWGTGHHFFVKPIEGLPWTLVVFRNKSILRAINFEILIFATCLFTVYILGLLIWGRILSTLYRFDQHGQPVRWLWPRQHALPAYKWLTALQMVLPFLVLMILMILDWRWGLSQHYAIVGLSIPFFTLWIVIRTLWKMACSTTTENQESEIQSRLLGNTRLLPRTYTLFALSTFFFLGSFPAIIMFKLGHDEEIRILAQQHMWEFAETLKANTLQPWMGLGKGEHRKDFQYTSSDHPCLFAGCGASTSNNQSPASQCANDLTAFSSGSNIQFALHNLYPDFSFPLCLSFQKDLKKEHPITTPAWLQTFHGLVRKSSLHNPIVQQSWGFLNPYPPNAPTRWMKTISKDRQTLTLNTTPFLANPQEGNGFATLWIRSSILVFPWNLLPFVIGCIMISGIFAFAGYIFLRFMITQVFPLPSFYFRSHDVLQHAPEPPGGSLHNLLLLGPPGTGKSAAIQRLSSAFEIFDFHSLLEQDQWVTSTLERLKGDTSPVVLDHFEYRLGDLKVDQEKRRIIGELLIRGRKLCVITSQDPFHESSPSGNQTASAEQMPTPNPWVSIFQSFGFTYFVPTKTEEVLREWISPSASHDTGQEQGSTLLVKTFLKTEEQPTSQLRNIGHWIRSLHEWPMWSPQELQEQFQFVASPYYRSLWESCTIQEKLALYHIAQDGFLHTQNPELPSLTQKGLVRVAPDLRIMNGSFRKFILDMGRDTHISEWQDTGNEETWANLRLPFLLVFAIILVFLFATQQEFKNSLITVISLLPILLPALPELPLLFTSPKNSSPPTG